MSAVCSSVEKRVSGVEDKVEEVKVNAASLEAQLQSAVARIDKLERDHADLREEFFRRIGEAEKRLGLIDERLDKLVPPPASTSSAEQGVSTSASPSPNCNDDTPYELRTCAKIGGFVFDTERQELLKEAKRCLAEAGVNESDWKWMHSPHPKVSWVLLTFGSATTLHRARQAFNAANVNH